MTLKEQIERLNQLKLRLAVWELLAAHLDDNFIGKDGRKPLNAIKPMDCLIDLVPEEVIEEVIQAIGSDYVNKIKKLIGDLENGQISVVTPEAN